MADNDRPTEKSAKHCKIFVGGLNRSTNKQDLREYFSQWGDITDAVVMTHPDSQESRGFGFVTFVEPGSVDEVLSSSAKPHILDGREVEAKRAVPREESNQANLQRTKKVFLGGLAAETSKEDILDVLHEFGTVLDVQIMTDKHTEKPRGFGFAIYEDFDSVDKLCNRKFLKIKDRDVEVKKAVSQDEMRKTDMGRRGQGGGGGGDSYKGDPYGSSRAPPYGGGGGSGGRGGYYRMSGYDYSRYPQSAGADYGGMMRSSHDYYNTAAMGGYPDGRGAVPGGGYAYAGAYRYAHPSGGYDMNPYGSMYGQNASAAMGHYNQTASAYGPSRGYSGGGGGSDPSKERDRSAAGGSRTYHPYKRY